MYWVGMVAGFEYQLVGKCTVSLVQLEVLLPNFIILAVPV